MGELGLRDRAANPTVGVGVVLLALAPPPTRHIFHLRFTVWVMGARCPVNKRNRRLAHIDI